MSNAGGADSSSSMISLHRSMHSSQMYTPGPAISFLTCRWDLPQKLQRSCSFESVGRAKIPPYSAAQGTSLAVRDHLVDQVVFLCLFGGHEVVALCIARDLFQILVRVLGQDLVQPAAHVDDLLRVDLDVRRLPLEAG